MQVNQNQLELENKQLKERLSEISHERDKYKKLFEVSADALSIIDLDSGKFIECNQAAVDMHGVQSIDCFLELSPADLSPEYQNCGRSSDDMAREYIEQAIKVGPQLFQWTHSRADASTFPCLVSLTPLIVGETRLILAIGRDISELMKAEAKLESLSFKSKALEEAVLEEQEKFEKFVNLAPVGIAINSIEDGSFDFVNLEFSKMTGYSIEELNNMDYWALTPKKYEQQEAEQLESLQKFGSYGPYQKEYIKKNGETNPVLLSGIKITNKHNQNFIWSVVQDISEQKRTEREIHEAREKADALALRLQLANDSAGIGVWEWDIQSGELVWDKWMYSLYGISESQFSGAYEAWVNSVHKDDIDDAKTQLDNAIKGKAVYKPEFRVTHPNGDIKTLKASAEVIRDSKGRALKVIGVNYDVTDRVEAMKTLTEAKKAAEKAVKAKSDFLANMSHEIRTPMNAILGALQLLKGAKLSPDLKTVLRNAVFSARSLLTIINDILDYSKIEANNLQLEDVQFSITETLESIKYDLDPIVSCKPIAFTVNRAQNLSEYWVGDLVRVKQVILNLTSNAVKFTEKGYVELNVYCYFDNKKEGLFIEIIDTGIGMTQEATQRVFERFEQADKSTTRKYGGTGLGMSITTNLIKMMHGTIDIQSTLDEGTKVTVFLPLKPVDFVSNTQIVRALSAPNLEGKAILVAEDNPINKVVIDSMLKPTKAHIMIVENGKQAVEIAQNQQFDLVLMDIHMPIMDGLEAQSILKERVPHLPVIALTANVMKEDIEKYLSRGFLAHIAKPIEMNSLYGTLNYHLLGNKSN
ncbi:PAS domain-containing sensor histidine kinase [Pseudoalteromonas phenolica]|uniref:Sensory/regulatory protein RpfC n=1 Tax=Pseudoalteromonas phenolica TaxID=161398 RepID=A0A5R9Q2M2_9GAMM|nr:PAS domain S-box protein [Pseudoalteromonas phenolica]TLX46637.1 PAS domain-containing sensor histidine kinase [Pseudoalteromonas phenolica]